MTTVASSTAATTTTSTATQTAAEKDRNTLGDSFDQFLTLLTTQLQNQDPMAPMDTNQFTQQLVQYSQVEQQIKTNDYMDKMLMTNQQLQNSQAVSYIDKEIKVEGNASYLSNEGDSASWEYSFDERPSSVTLTVVDAEGNVVYSEPGENVSGTHKFTWNGKDSEGANAPVGEYRLNVTVKDETGAFIETSTDTIAKVTGVETADGETKLLIGEVGYAIDKVKKVTNPAETTTTTTTS